MRQPEKQKKKEEERCERGIMEEWRRVGGKREEGTINWLEPRSQERGAGCWGFGICKRSQESRPILKDGGVYNNFVLQKEKKI